MSWQNANFIHPTAVIHPEAKIGRNNHIGPYCVIERGVELGNDNQLTSFVSLGMEPEHKDYFTRHGRLKIGSGNIFREFVRVHSGTRGATEIHNKCLFLNGAYVAHDCVLEDHVTLSAGVALGGGVYVMRSANLGMNATVHQRQTIGSFTMIGMGAVVTKKMQIRPGGIFVGSPAIFKKTNSVGLERAGVVEADLQKELARFAELCQRPPL